jgi:hypothetical protein
MKSLIYILDTMVWCLFKVHCSVTLSVFNMMGSEMRRTLIEMDPHYLELLATDPGVQITILILKKVT